MEPDLVLDVALPPAGALTQIAGAINKKKRRAFGVLKVENEYVGLVTEDRFEIWERRQRAVHALGRVSARGARAQVEVRYVLSRQTRVLLPIFFALYALVAAAITSQAPDPAVSLSEAVVAASGAVVLGAFFYAAGRRQRDDLARFLNATLARAS